MDMMTVIRTLAAAGVSLLLLAGLVYLISTLDLPMDRLPGDMIFKRGNLTCVVPLMTSLLLSVVLTVLLNIIIRFFRR